MTRSLLLLAVVAACGGGGSSGDPKEPDDEKAEKDAPPPPPRTRFRYSCDQKQVFDALVAAVRSESPPLDVSDASAGLVTTSLTWHDGRGRPKHPSQPILKEDLALVLELAVIASGGAREVRAHARVFDSGPGGRGPEVPRDKPGWPGWADEKVARVLAAVDQRLAKCLVQPDE